MPHFTPLQIIIYPQSHVLSSISFVVLRSLYFILPICIRIINLSLLLSSISFNLDIVETLIRIYADHIERPHNWSRPCSFFRRGCYTSADRSKACKRIVEGMSLWTTASFRQLLRRWSSFRHSKRENTEYNKIVTFLNFDIKYHVCVPNRFSVLSKQFLRARHRSIDERYTALRIVVEQQKKWSCSVCALKCSLHCQAIFAV